MKKVLLGCGAIIVILLVLGAIAGVLTAKNLRRARAESASAAADLTSTNQDFPFTAPADGQLAEARLVIWLSVREQALARDRQRRTAARGGPLKKVQLLIDNRAEVLKEYQALLKTEKMAMAEYLWITDQVMGALLSRPAAKDPKLAALAMLAQMPDPTLRGPRFDGGGFRRRGYAPLDPAEATPILALLLKHEAEFRKVGQRNLGDGYLEEMGRRPVFRRLDDATTRSIPRRDDRGTTR